MFPVKEEQLAKRAPGNEMEHRSVVSASRALALLNDISMYYIPGRDPGSVST